MAGKGFPAISMTHAGIARAGIGPYVYKPNTVGDIVISNMIPCGGWYETS